MAKPTPNAVAYHGSILLCRLATGVFLLVAGYGKVHGEVTSGLGHFYHSDGFRAVQPSWLPDLIAGPYGYALPWAELILGGLLVIGLFGRVAAGLIALLLVSILIATINAMGITAMPPGMGMSPAYLMLPIALLLVVLGPGAFAIDVLWRRRAKAG